MMYSNTVKNDNLLTTSSCSAAAVNNVFQQPNSKAMIRSKYNSNAANYENKNNQLMFDESEQMSSSNTINKRLETFEGYPKPRKKILNIVP